MGCVLYWPLYSKYRARTNKVSCGCLCSCMCIPQSEMKPCLFLPFWEDWLLSIALGYGLIYRDGVCWQEGSRSWREWSVDCSMQNLHITVLIVTRLSFSITGNEVQEYIVSVRHSMFAEQDLGVSTFAFIKWQVAHKPLANTHTVSLKHSAGLGGRHLLCRSDVQNCNMQDTCKPDSGALASMNFPAMPQAVKRGHLTGFA